MGKTIKLKNVGAIKEAEIPYIEGGGVVELLGPQGCGKSTTLDAIDCAVSGRGKPPLRDHAQSGTIEGLGVSIRLGARTTRNGAPEVLGLDAKLSVADIVDPGVADPMAADAKRIDALVKLAGIKPSREMFLPIFGDEQVFDAIVQPDSLAAPDLVQAARQIKRDCERAAREEEQRVAQLDAQLAGLKAQLDNVDLSAECDELKLRAAYTEAVATAQRLKAARDQAMRMAAEADAARDKLRALESEQVKSVDDAATDHLLSMDDLREAQEKLERVQALVKLRRERADEARAALKRSQEHAALVDHWQRYLAEASADARITDAEVQAADEQARAAEQAMVRGAHVLSLKHKAKELAGVVSAHDRSKAAAQQLRHAALATECVVSSAFAALGTPLSVEGGRLMIPTERGPTPFGELSDGERWKIALDVAIGCVGEHGVLTIPQWAWGELQPANKRAIAERLRACKVLAYTAVATDGAGLSAQEFTE